MVRKSGTTSNRSPDSTVELRIPTAGAEAGAADSRVTVTVQQRSPYTVGEPSSATVTVTDMEKALPRLALLATEPSAFEGDTLEFTLTRTGPTGTALDVGLEVSETGAVVTDYPTAVRIERGQSAATFTVETRGDSESGTRSVVMVAMKKDAERYRFGNNSRAVSVTVKDTTDMQRAVVPEVTVSTGRASVSEGSPIEVTLTRTGGGEAVTVGLSVSETGNMLSAVVSQVPLAENASSATFSLLTLDDETDEKDSVVTVEIVPDAERYDVGEPSSVAVTVEDDDEAGARAAEPLTAAFEAVPESHDGDSAFTFELRFSEEPAAGGRYVARLRDHAFEVTGGRVREAERLAAPSNVRWRIEVEPDSRADVVVTLPGNRACDAPGAICADDERKLSNSPSLRVEGPAAEPLTAAFEAVPESHDGDSPFTFELRFSEEPAAGGRYVARLRDHAFEVTGGRVREAERLAAPSNVRWRIEVEPDSRADVVVTLPGNRACEGPGAICAEDGRRLSNSPSLRVEGPPAEPLTAAFEDMPAVHDGDDFTFGLTFSEEPAVSFRKLRDHAFEVGGGAVRTARRRQQGSNRGWTITVEPSGFGEVSIRLPQTGSCDAQGAICTGDRRPLSHALSATVRAPVGVGVSDARVTEAAGAVVAFAVTLSRAASGRVTVDYATSDGTAQAGVDYTAARGTLAFAAGESSKTIEVGVLDDAHDEGEETFTLALSNASGGRLTDGEATGTIENRDPLPRALLARFGRTAAVHVVEHVEERLQAPRAPGFEGRFAGRELRPGMEREMALSFLNQLGGMAGASPAGAGGASGYGAGVHRPLAGSAAGGAGSLGTPGLGGGARMGAAGGAMGAMGVAAGLGGPAAPLAAAGSDGGFFNGGSLLQMGLGGGDLLTGSAFALNRESHGGILSFWSRGAQSRFTGREGTLGLNGDVRTTMFGADYARGPLVAGLSLSHSRGLGEYSGVAAGQVLSSVTGLYPWLGYQATDRVTVWGVAGYGAGGMLLTPAAGPALESGLSMAMAAAGTRGELIAGGAGGFELAFKADALWVGTSTDGVDGAAGRLAATEAAVTRFRTGLEGSRDYTLGGRLSLRPSVEVGLRHDGGDAETGAGMDVGAGLVVSDKSTGLAVDVRVRTLLVHQAEGFSERGVALSLSYNPTPSSPLGFTAKVAPSWGGEARSGAEALWGRETMAGMAHGSFASGNRLDGEVGYGVPMGSRLVGTPRVGFSTSEYGRDYRVGYGLGVLDRESLNFELGVDAQRRESPMLGGASNGVLGRASLGW